MTKHVFRKIFFREHLIIYLNVLISLIILGSVLINKGKMEGFALVGIFVFTLFLLLIFAIILNYLIKMISIHEIKKYSETLDPEVAVIFGEDRGGINQGLVVSSYTGSRFLFKYLKLKNKKFITYIMPDKKTLAKIIQNRKIKTIYLIGHGSKRGFALNNKEDSLSYSIYKRSKNKKEEIHLYHCTDSKENPPSIIDYLVIPKNRSKCFITNKAIALIEYPSYFYDLYREEKNKH